jgi:hypothetical protein
LANALKSVFRGCLEAFFPVITWHSTLGMFLATLNENLSNYEHFQEQPNPNQSHRFCDYLASGHFYFNASDVIA